jgi:hypothetical protein
MLPELNADSLLTLWEHALHQPAASRGDTLLRAMAQGAEPPRRLSERNARFLEIHACLFGRDLDLISRCPACGTVAQFSGDCETLSYRLNATSAADHAPSHRLAIQDHHLEFHLPDSDDVRAASAGDTADDFVWRLLDRCVLSCTCGGTEVPVRQLPEPVLDALSESMRALAPGASVSFAVACPECHARWEAPLDLAQLVWQKVQASAERLLFDVDVLARAYGWTEAEVLRLSPLRRSAYLQIVTS